MKHCLLILATIFGLHHQFHFNKWYFCSVNVPCKVSDLSSCMEKFLNNVLKAVTSGIPELDIESADPLWVEKIDGDLPTLKYLLFDNILSGYKSCFISNVRINEEITSLKYDLNCDKLSLSGNYKMNGTLVALPVEGKGNYESIAAKYIVHFVSAINKVEGKDGKISLAIENKRLKCVPLDVITYNFQNLFYGQQNDLAEAIHKFAAEHWRDVAEIVQDPIWYALANKITGNINKYLKSIALDDIIRQ